MTINGSLNGHLKHGIAAGDGQRVSQVLAHVATALSWYVRRQQHDSLPLPREVEELTSLLTHLARVRHGSPSLAVEGGVAQNARMPDRLLVTKGEAAERLSVSVRTIERLVAAGRLPQVHVERLARFRLCDLQSYVDSLSENHGPDAISRE